MSIELSKENYIFSNMFNSNRERVLPIEYEVWQLRSGKIRKCRGYMVGVVPLKCLFSQKRTVKRFPTAARGR